MHLKYSLCLAFLLLAMCTTALPKNKYKPDTMDVSAILIRSQKAYQDMKLYLDSGKMIDVINSNSGVVKSAKYFKTACANGTDFNFEYYVEGTFNSLYTVTRLAGKTKSWWGVTNKTDTVSALKQKLATMVGVSSSLSYLIPCLLLKNDFDPNGTFYHRLGNSVLAATAVVSGVACYVIVGKSDKTKLQTTLYISKKDFLIRKVELDQVISAASIAASRKLADSLMKKYAAKDPAIRKRDSTTKAILARLPVQSPPTDMTTHSIIMYYPYTVRKFNPAVLFKFRPNREVAL